MRTPIFHKHTELWVVVLSNVQNDHSVTNLKVVQDKWISQDPATEQQLNQLHWIPEMMRHLIPDICHPQTMFEFQREPISFLLRRPKRI
jgi:hypothetical protein